MKRVFLSFMVEDRQTVNGIRLLASNPRHPIEFYDESVTTPYNSNNADYIKQQIREKINRTSVTVCISSRNTHTSQWVNWELEISMNKGNTIILMAIQGLTQVTLPASVREHTCWTWDMAYLTRLIEEAQ